MERQPLAPGSARKLGGISYEIEGVEGCGSSAIVYRASYRDALSPEALHHVLLKELFPLSETGAIYRTEAGEIACTEEGRTQFAYARRRFLMGNEINLTLLGSVPSGTSGNLNSYEAYGTYYSVLSVHGGETLLRLLERRGSLPLREAAGVLQKLLDALSVFHENGLLHLDISPDNVLLLPSYALLIDFNSVWSLRGENGADFAFSRKPGYTAPEVLLQNFRDIGFATDLYACCAVFFHLLTGRRLREEETVGGYLRRTLSRELECLRDVPETAAAKTAQILLRGLHTLSRRRYQSTGELAEDLRELLRRLDGFGVTASALWESSAALCRGRRQEATAYLSQAVSGADGVLNRAELIGLLAQGGCFLLTGPGGMGKTRLLTELWRQGSARWQAAAPVFLFFSLRDYQETGGEPFFLRRSMLSLLRFPPEHAQVQDARHRLEALLDEPGPGGQAAVILLLDGLNEAGPHRERLLTEIEGLGKKRGVGVLVTDRSDAVLSYALEGFSPLSLAPLTREQVGTELAGAGISLPVSEGLLSLLSTPMLLFLYRDALAGGGTQEDGAAPETADALVSLYLDRFLKNALRADAGSPGRQLCTRYLLEQLLPEIALELQRRDRTLLPFEALCRITDRSYRRLHGRAFGAAFPAYRGKTRVMLEGIANAEEWYDFAVNDRLADKLGLLSAAANGCFGLLHDTFRPVLARRAEENGRQLARGGWIAWRGRAAAALAALVLIGGAGAALYRAASGSDAVSYTQEESGQIYDAVSCLNTSLGKWSSQIAAQREILDRAAISDVLDNGDGQALEELEALIGQKEQFLDSVYASPLDGKLAASLRALAERKALFPVETLETLCARSGEQEAVMAAALPQLREALCAPDSVYDSRDKRERLILAYQEYLEAETQYVSYLLASLLAELPEENQADVLAVVTYLEAFSDFYSGAGSVSPERLPDGTQRAREALRTARLELTAQGLSIEWPELPRDPGV